MANDGRITLAVNGHEVSGVSKCNPRQGYLALESEGSVCHFKNLKMKELPSTNPKKDEIADQDQGYKSMFTGLDLTGWKADKDDWKVSDGVLRSAGKPPLVSVANKFTKCELIFDWKLPAQSAERCRVEIGTPERAAGAVVAQMKEGEVFLGRAFRAGGAGGLESESGSWHPFAGINLGAWNRTVIRIGGGPTRVSVNGKELSAPGRNPPPAGPITFRSAEGLELRSIFIREIKP
jgi:hypothetical protein